MPSKADAGAAITRFLQRPNSRTDFLGSFLVCVDLPEDDALPIRGRTALFSGMIYGIGPTIAQYWSAAAVAGTAWKTNAAVSQPELEEAWAAKVRECAANSGSNILARSNTLIDFKGPHPDNARNARLELQFKGPRDRADQTRVQPTLAETSRERLDFFNRLSASDYSIHAASSRQLAGGIEKERRGAGALVGQQNRFEANNYLDLRGYAVRRACKYLLYDTIGVSREDKGHVHYALDGITLADVAGRTHRALDSTTFKVPVCTSELRELFRMWAFFRDDVTFYANFAKANPPWETSDQETWARYALARTRKMAARLTTTEQQAVADAVQASRWKQAIDAYHAIPAYKVQSKGLPAGI